jgi:hypothetical protein
MLRQNPFFTKVAENNLDRARQAGLISYDEYRARGGRDIVPGLQKGNQALIRINNIRQTSSPEQMAEWVSQSDAVKPALNPKYHGTAHEGTAREIVRKTIERTGKAKVPGVGQAFASPHANALFTDFDPDAGYGVPEVTTRHEIDEIRYGRNPKGRLNSAGHLDSRIITNEFRNTRRLDDITLPALREMSGEAPLYFQKTKGAFNYGRGTSQIPDKKFWADTAKSIADETPPAPQQPGLLQRIRDKFRKPESPGTDPITGLPKDAFDTPTRNNMLYAAQRNQGYKMLHPSERKYHLENMRNSSPMEVFRRRNDIPMGVLKTDPEFAELISQKTRPTALLRGKFDEIVQSVRAAKDRLMGQKLLPGKKSVITEEVTDFGNLPSTPAPAPAPVPTPATLPKPGAVRAGYTPKPMSPLNTERMRQIALPMSPLNPERFRQIALNASKPKIPGSGFKGVGSAIKSLGKIV